MLKFSLIRLENLEPALWKNGQGFTRELYKWPVGVPLDHPLFAFRLSVAETQKPAAFSVFPGLKRLLAIRGKKAVPFRVEGHALTIEPKTWWAFDGEDRAELLRPPLSDLHFLYSPKIVKVQPGIFSISKKPKSYEVGGRFNFFFCEEGEARLLAYPGEKAVKVKAGDTALLEILNEEAAPGEPTLVQIEPIAPRSLFFGIEVSL